MRRVVAAALHRPAGQRCAWRRCSAPPAAPSPPGSSPSEAEARPPPQTPPGGEELRDSAKAGAPEPEPEPLPATGPMARGENDVEAETAFRTRVEGHRAVRVFRFRTPGGRLITVLPVLPFAQQCYWDAVRAMVEEADAAYVGDRLFPTQGANWRERPGGIPNLVKEYSHCRELHAGLSLRQRLTETTDDALRAGHAALREVAAEADAADGVEAVVVLYELQSYPRLVHELCGDAEHFAFASARDAVPFCEWGEETLDLKKGRAVWSMLAHFGGGNSQPRVFGVLRMVVLLFCGVWFLVWAVQLAATLVFGPSAPPGAAVEATPRPVFRGVPFAVEGTEMDDSLPAHLPRSSGRA